jgi:hypothetical protein
MININIRYLEKEVEKIKTLYLNKKFEQVIKKTKTLLKKKPQSTNVLQFNWAIVSRAR